MSPPTRLSPLGLATLLLGAFLSMADFFIVNVALPTIDSRLHASSATLELVVAGYGIPYALLLVVGGRLGDLYGRRRLFMAGTAVFTVASLLCGLAPTALALVACRALQGAAAALLVPQVLATIQASAGENRARALGLYGATAGTAAVVGQLAGGAIVAANVAGTAWRPIFLVNVPLGLAALVLASRHVPATRAIRPERIDAAGTVVLAVAVLALLVPLTEGRALGWPSWSFALLALAAVAATGFVLIERRVEERGRHALVPPSVLRLRGMRRGLLIVVPFFAAFGAFMFAFAIALQDGAGRGPLGAGVTLAPLALSFLVASLSTPRLVAAHGARVLTAGASVQGLGLAALAGSLVAFWPHVDVVDLAPALVIAGFGQGHVVGPLFGFVLAGVPAARAGVGSGVLNTTLQASLALGVATLGSLFLSLEPARSLGVRDAFVAVVLVELVAAAVVAVASRALEAPGRGEQADEPAALPEPAFLEPAA